MTEVTVNIEIYCGKCGTGSICNNATQLNSRGYGNKDVTIEIEPCESCLQSAKEDGYQEGHQNGYEEGYNKGCSDNQVE